LPAGWIDAVVYRTSRHNADIAFLLLRIEELKPVFLVQKSVFGEP
jgi:hypothetical protein